MLVSNLSDLSIDDLSRVVSDGIAFIKKHVTTQFANDELKYEEYDAMVRWLVAVEGEVRRRRVGGKLEKAVSRFGTWREVLETKMEIVKEKEERIKARIGEAVVWTEEEREKVHQDETQRIVREIEQINAMNKLIAEQVEDQAEPLDTTNETVSEAMDNTDKALNELSSASKNRWSTFSTTVGLAAGIVCGGGAAVAGAAMAPAVIVGGAGAYVGRKIGKSIAKRAHENSIAGIQEHIASAPQ